MNNKLKQAIDIAKRNPNSEYAVELRRRIETGELDNELHSSGLSQYATKPQETSYIERVGKNFGDITNKLTGNLEKAGTQYLESAKKGNIGEATGGLLRGGLRAVGAVTEGAFTPIVEAPIVKQALDFIGEKISDTEVGKKLAQKIQENPEKAQDIMDIVNTLTLGGGKVAEKPVAVGIEKAVTSGKEALQTGINTLKTKEALKTATQVDDLVGKIIQGAEKDIPKAKKALRDIDTTNIKSYKDLSSNLNDKVSNLTTKLDDILSKNTTKIGLEDAKNIIKVGEKSVEHNFVKDALVQLDDYFTKINDITGKENINQLKNKFNTDGVTIKDINDLARLHGEKMNAYNASGELASGLTKQAAENTRAGLKSTARDLFGDKVYKEIDNEISNVIRTRDLVDNVSKKVNQLQQKINQRGFGEKVGRLAFQVADKFTGGGLKGFVQSFVPRGEGLKIMNALDLERSLNKNLNLLDKAMNSKTESATIKALQGILDYINNPKIGLSIEDVSKNQSSDAFLNNQPTTNIVNKTPKSVISPNSTTKTLKNKGTIPENSLIEEVNYMGEHRPDLTGDLAYNIKDISKLRSQIVQGKNSSDLFNKLQKMQGNPEMEVTVYRSSPKNELNSGDWVTLDKDYAQRMKNDTGGKINTFKVKTKDLIYNKGDNSGNGFNFGYKPTKNSLIQEAKKYKSAEEFVKAQQEKLYIHGSHSKINGELKLNSKALGVQQPESNAVDVLYVTPNTETGIMHSRMYTKQNGVIYGIELKPDTKIFDYTNPIHRKMIDNIMTDTQKRLVKDNLIDGQLSWMATPPVKEIKKLGFDGMKQIERKAGEDAYSATFGDAKYPENAESLMLFNKNSFKQIDISKSKSKLEEIWKKANNK